MRVRHCRGKVGCGRSIVENRLEASVNFIPVAPKFRGLVERSWPVDFRPAGERETWFCFFGLEEIVGLGMASSSADHRRLGIVMKRFKNRD